MDMALTRGEGGVKSVAIVEAGDGGDGGPSGTAPQRDAQHCTVVH